jgi:hypothetical protein
MKIRMIGLASGPKGHMHPDGVYDVDDVLGKQLIEQLQAVAEESDAPVAKPSVDTTPAPIVLSPAETAALRAKGKRF